MSTIDINVNVYTHEHDSMVWFITIYSMSILLKYNN